MMIQSAYEFFYEIFLSTGISGYLGPMAIIIVGYILINKNTALGIIWFIVECLMIAQYAALLDATPDYIWQIYILLFGGLLTCVFPLWEQRRR